MTPTAVSTAPLAWTWIGPDGTEWNLTDRTSPVLKLRGATGVGLGTPEHVWVDSPTLDGSTWDGVRIPRGEVFLPLMVRGTDSLDFLRKHGEFLRSLNPREWGTLRVDRPDGESRYIKCRYQGGADTPIDLDPVKVARATYGITWATEEPYWTGEPIEVRIENPTDLPLFPGPPFNINSAQTFASARFTNPGDSDSSAAWRINGPFTGFSVGLGESLVTMALTKTVGGWIDIAGQPGAYGYITDETGADRWLSASAVSFATIPPGVNVPLSVAVQGASDTSLVQMWFTPRYGSIWT